MSRPGSSALSVTSFQGSDRRTPGPSCSPANDYYPQQQGDGFRPTSAQGWEMGPGGGSHGMPEGRVVYTLNGHPSGPHGAGPSSMPHHQSHSPEGEGDFLPVDDHAYHYNHTTPYPQHQLQQPPHSHMPIGYSNGLTPYHPGSTPVPHLISPTATMGLPGRPLMHGQSPADQYHMQSTPVPQQQYYNAPPRRPGMASRHTTMAAPRPPIQRQYSLQPPPSRMVDSTGQDVFAVPPGSTPIRRAMSGSSEYNADNQFFNVVQGISPARALGPAPAGASFSPTVDPLITPLAKQTAQQTPTSAVSTAMTASSTRDSAYSPPTTQQQNSDEDDDNYSPTRPQFKNQNAEIILEPVPRRQQIIVPPVRPKTVIGGRTSAKFAKVAEDPGVEGVPPGPRPTERPTPSFACIIGQAILRCSAGGLSLEHIYRYVETAYPYFKNGDGAWRNSVRHNLSIHKMFETIPRTEHYPPGKGGIWIIHDEEKIHWPSEDKFIKNFPTTHAHHGVCRQTVHERQKEQEAIAKAHAEGKEYVPKKGKKGRKLADDCSSDMIRGMSDGAGPSHMPYPVHHPQPVPVHSRPPPILIPTSIPVPLQRPTPTPEPESTTPKMPPKIMHPPPFFRPLDEESMVIMEDTVPKGTMVPPRFGLKRPMEGDEENVFSAPKRVRVAEPLPLMPIQQESVEDAYVTPERDRPTNKPLTVMDSAFKTPGLVNTTSSPGSSPMPPTIPRTSNHNPSALQQTWTQADIVPHSSPAFLDAAFDIKPKHHFTRSSDEEYRQSASSSYIPPPKSPRAPPKTPLTRSSAAADRTPRLNLHRTPFAKTPMMHFGSPILPRLNHFEVSTPAWEIAGILDRLGGVPSAGTMLGTGPGATGMQIFTPMKSPTKPSSSGSGSLPLGLRSPLTSTDPGRHSLGSQANTPTKRTFTEHGSPTSSPSLRHLVNPLAPPGLLMRVHPVLESPTTGKITAAAASIGRSLRIERERTRSGEMKAGI